MTMCCQHGMASRDATDDNEGAVLTQLNAKCLKRRPRPKLKVGDRIRFSKKYRPFKKGYLPGWTEEVFVVCRVQQGSVPSYKVEEMDGTPLEGTFYEQDLQKVTVDDDSLFRLEKILKRSKDKLLVQWKGWPNKYKIWIHKRDVQA